MKTERAPKILLLVLSIIILLATGSIAVVADGQAAKTEGAIYQRVAGMNDAEVRDLLITEMKEQEATAGKVTSEEIPGPGAPLGALLNILGRQSDHSQNQLRELADKIPNLVTDFYRVFLKLGSYNSPQGALINILWVLFFISIGLTADMAVNRLLRKRFDHISSTNLVDRGLSDGTMAISEKFIASIVMILPAIIGLFVFFITAYAGYFTFFWVDLPFLNLFFLAILLIVTIIRAITILATMVFEPYLHRIRIVPLSSATALSCYRCIVWTLGYIVVVLVFGVVIYRIGAQPETVIWVQLCAATVLLAVTAVAVVIYRKDITAYILKPSQEDTDPPSWGKKNFAAIWHFLALFYLAILWFLMIASVLGQGTHTNGAFIISFFILPIWVLADLLLQWVVKYIMVSLKLCGESSVAQPTADMDGSDEQHQGRELFLKTKLYSRLILVLAVGLWVASLWGYTIPFISGLSGVLFNSLIIMTVALVFWQFISSWLERKISESVPESSSSNDGVDDEWGAAATQGRAYTLLPIIRSFIASILVVMVTLTILSSVGVNIGPLLAGAGVVGLAIGFGAQKIVADILSGIFYLLDDAFRVGEYLSAGGINGTVESISLRNVMLRHHRGMLQIVPHSKLGTITNYMRGGVIDKFNLDFAYDADIDKIRKIIKRVGQEMLEDPELGKGFIHPLKCQGVNAIANSVMTIRVKFTARPGTQFVIRREAYKRITLALNARGIYYAHKKVIVDLPAPLTGHEDPAQMQKIAQAAGGAAREIFDEEEKLKQQLANEKSTAKSKD